MVNGLEQVVEGAKLERRNRVVIERRDKNHRRHLVGSHFGNHVEAVELRHLDVEEHQIGLIGSNRRDGFQAVLAFTYNLDIGDACEQ